MQLTEIKQLAIIQILFFFFICHRYTAFINSNYSIILLHDKIYKQNNTYKCNQI